MDPNLHTGVSAPDATAHACRPWGAALVMVVLIAAFFVLREPWGHLAGSWPYLLLLACTVMYLFHRRGGHGPWPGKE
jgi:Protein of unknown function (DUF2933)